MYTIVAQESFLLCKIEKCSMSDARLLGRLTWVSGPGVLFAKCELKQRKTQSAHKMCIEMDNRDRPMDLVKRS